MAFANFMKSLGKVIVPPKRIREWRKLKRQYRAYLQGLPNINPKDVRRGVREWMEKNPKPKRTGKEKEDIRQILSEIPQEYEKMREEFGNGGNGVQTETFTGQTTLPRKAMISPWLFLLLIPIFFPKFLKWNK